LKAIHFETADVLRILDGLEEHLPITFVEAPSGTYTEETTEKVEEAELDETRDLNTAEDAPTEYLSEDQGSD
jgi:hypothetical protein